MAVVEGSADTESSSLAPEGVLAALLRRHPTARLGALAGDYDLRFIPLPAPLPVPAGQPLIEAGSVKDILSPGDRVAAAELWCRAMSEGMVFGELALADGSRRGVYVLNLRHECGLMVLALLEEGDTAEPLPLLPGTVHSPSPVGRNTKDQTAVFVSVDGDFERLLGWDAGELVGTRNIDLVHPADREMGVRYWVRMLTAPGPAWPHRLRYRHKDGRWLWVEVLNHNRLGDPAHGDVLSEVRDVTAEMEAVETLQSRQELLEQVTETIHVGLLHADRSGRLLYGNRRLTELTGLCAGDLLSDWPGIVGGHLATLGAALRAGVSGTAAEHVLEVGGRPGGSRHFSLSVRPLFERSGRVCGVTGSVQDITVRIHEQRELEQRAATDPLTGCLNRSAVLAVMSDALGSLGDRPGEVDGVAVMFIDVDDLKSVNDHFGHAAGDRLLRDVADRLRGALRARDAVGRFGGDEFLVVAQHVGSPEHALTIARWVSERILRGTPASIADPDPRVSIGVSWTATGDVAVESMVRQADAAMYLSKQQGLCRPMLADGLAVSV